MMRRSRSAFTLLELLIAMALMSMLAASLYASLHVAFQARSVAVAALEPVRRAELAIELLRQDIESALPPTGILAGEFFAVDGKDDSGRDSDALLLHSSAHNPGPDETASEIRRVEFAAAVRAGGTEPVLVRRISTNLLAPAIVEPWEEVLCRGVLAFNLRYFDGSAWLDGWDSAVQDNVLPLAVEVTIEVDRPTREPTPDGGYRVCRVLLLPCGRLADVDGTRVIRSSIR